MLKYVFFKTLLCRYLYLHYDTPIQRKLWNVSFQQHIISGKHPDDCSTLVAHITETPMSLHHQFAILSSISNYHWLQYIKCDGDISSGSIHVNLHQHLLYHPSCDINDDNLRGKHLPKSPRNRLMYYILYGNIYPGLAFATLKQLLTIDEGGDILLHLNQMIKQTDRNEPTAKKLRKHTVLNLTGETLCKSLGIPETVIENCADVNRSLYTVFTEQMLTFGEVTWCHHSQMEDVVILSDYDPSTGTLLPSSYSHVTCTTEDISQKIQYIIKCSCEMYNIMQSALISDLCGESETDQLVLDHTSLTCMHCRFYKDNLYTLRDILHEMSESTELSKKITKSLPNLNNPIVLLGMPSQSRTTKFSISSEGNYSTVHITFTQTGARYAS